MSTGGNPALKFVVEVQNKQAINELTEDIKQQEHEIKILTAALKAGAISETQFKTQAMAAGQAIANANKEIHALGGAAGTAGRGLAQLSYAIDDIQYGFNAIVNNIPQIVMGFGAGAGVAGAVGIAAVAVNQLIKHWGELSDIAQSAWAGGSIDQLQKLREGAEEAAKAFDKLIKEHNKATEETLKFRHEGIVEGGAGKILEALTAGIAMDPGMRAELSPQDERDRKDKIAMAKRLANEQDRISQLAKIEENYGGGLMKKNRDKAVMMLYGIENDDKVALARARSMVQANPGAFPKDFIQKLDPEAGAAEAVRKSNQENEALARKQAHAREAENRKKIEHDAEMLTKEGQQQEAFMNRRLLEDQKRDLQEEIKRGEHVLTPEGKRQLQDQMLGGRAPEESKIMSVKAFADKMLTAGMNTIPQKQLDKLVDMHNTLKDIDKKMRAQGLE